MASQDKHPISADEAHAEKIARIAVFFMNSSAPVPSSRVYELFYPGQAPATARKNFGRDRKTLDSAGVYLQEVSVPSVNEKCWQVDECRSYAAGAELGAFEAMALNLACQPLLADEGFVFGDELRFALAKIDRNFGAADRAVQTRTCAESKAAKVVVECMGSHQAVAVSYRDARGRASERTFLPYGSFSCRGHGYVVGDCIQEDGSKATRTLRLDRIERAKATQEGFEVPAGFDINEHVKLPFQIGPTVCRAVFAAGEGGLPDAARVHGEVRVEDGRETWSVEASSIEDAACWAVAEGLVPVFPPELVGAWKSTLEGAIRGE